eukprot:GSChrysophyteH1.ASY1.ANO1.1307.1 assembled CDS
MCRKMKKHHKVGLDMQNEWGTLPSELQGLWENLSCSDYFRKGLEGLKQVMGTAADKLLGEQKVESPLMGAGASSRLAEVQNLQGTAAELPLISIMAGSTSRKVDKPSVRNLSLFIYLLPSLIRTLDCGFRYEYVLGYDIGDPFYDSEKGMSSVDSWFAENVIKPMGRNGIMILPVRKRRINNTLKKPGPVFNEMARAAFEGGADYMYRVNDDTEFVHKWPKLFVDSLNTIPNKIGAIGPTCTQGNTDILTHDFVARIHMDIHEMNYYPPELVDWWMDDWISFVYGPKRTFKSSEAHVIHHTGAHGRRYQVNDANRRHLTRVLMEGKNRIRSWLLKTNADDSAIKSWDKHSHRTHTFRHKDVPFKYKTANS